MKCNILLNKFFSITFDNELKRLMGRVAALVNRWTIFEQRFYFRQFPIGSKVTMVNTLIKQFC